MAVTCKPTVRLVEMTPELMTMFRALITLDGIAFAGWPGDLVITSINDSKHRQGSKHYVNKALDLRSKSFTGSEAKAAFVDALRDELGAGYTVLFEGAGTEQEHWHVQSRK